MDRIILALQEFVASGLFVDELRHGLIAVPFAIFLWSRTKSWRAICAFYFVVYAIDADHLFDYWLSWGLGFDPYDFIKLDYFEMSGRAFVPFHGWEWVAILGWFASRKKKPWRSLQGIAAWGILAHLSWDIFTVGSIIFYSFLYRAITGFALV